MRQQLVALLLGEVSKKVRGEMFKPTPEKSAPSYSQAAVPTQVLIGGETAEIDGRSVAFQMRGYPPDVLLIEARTEVDNLFRRETFALEEKIYEHAYGMLLAHGGNRDFSEEYSVFLISGYEGPPEAFLDQSPIMATLLKSERMELDPKEIEHTLQTQIKYARNDLAILDWDGAFLFDAEGETQEDIELLVLANLQLLRHRILDRQLDERLAHMANLVHKTVGRKPLRHKELIQDLRALVSTRMTSISELHRLERDIKLIGDWYSARFFELATTKFKIEEWRRAIRNKLDSLEDIYSLVAENFAVSAKDRAETIQIIAFFILQVGWFLLIILEFWYFTHRR